MLYNVFCIDQIISNAAMHLYVCSTGIVCHQIVTE